MEKAHHLDARRGGHGGARRAHLANDFEAAFDLVVFQLVRAVFARGYTGSWHALDIVFNETAARPTSRMTDDDFAADSSSYAVRGEQGARIPGASPTFPIIGTMNGITEICGGWRAGTRR